jgi:hypothetical protein
MSFWVSVPIITGAAYVNLTDPNITADSRIEIARSTPDTRDAKVTKQAQGHCTITFERPTQQNQYLRYAVRNSAGTT